MGPYPLEQAIGGGGVELYRPCNRIFPSGSPLLGKSYSILGKKIARGFPLGGMVCGEGFTWPTLRRGPDHDWYLSDPATQNLLVVVPQGEVRVPDVAQILLGTPP